MTKCLSKYKLILIGFAAMIFNVRNSIAVTPKHCSIQNSLTFSK